MNQAVLRMAKERTRSRSGSVSMFRTRSLCWLLFFQSHQSNSRSKSLSTDYSIYRSRSYIRRGSTSIYGRN